MLPEEIKHYILTLKHSQERHEVIHHPLKRTLNRGIKLYGIVLNEIQTEQGSPRIKNISFKFGFNKREHELKYRQPDFVCPFYSKRPYWYYYTYISVVYLSRPCSCNYGLGKSFEEAIAKLNSVCNPFLRNFFTTQT